MDAQVEYAPLRMSMKCMRMSRVAQECCGCGQHKIDALEAVVRSGIQSNNYNNTTLLLRLMPQINIEKNISDRSPCRQVFKSRSHLREAISMKSPLSNTPFADLHSRSRCWDSRVAQRLQHREEPRPVPWYHSGKNNYRCKSLINSKTISGSKKLQIFCKTY